MELKPNLPRKIIENILSQIPVKYLFRFKSVCKQWNSTISDPRFSEIHVKQFKKSWPRSLLAWEEDDFEGFYIAKLQKHEFQFVSVIKYPWEEDDLAISIIRSIVCYCDGLYLKRFQDHEQSNYILWNPSTRTYRKLCCPDLIDNHRNLVFYGMCYDPLMKDYKIVIGDMKHYAVFMCRNNKWGDVKEMEECFSKVNVLFLKSGISFNGSYYWIMFTEIEYMKVEFEIICFDFGDEKFKKMHKPDFEVEYNDLLDLASIVGHLCLLVMRYNCNQMRIMKKVEEEDSWIEFKVLEHLPFHNTYDVCSINEDEVILDVNSVLQYQLYDQSIDAFVEIERNPHREYSNPVPYLENLLLLIKITI